MRMQDRVRVFPAVATLAVAGLLSLPVVTLASHQPTVADIVAEATSPTWNMTCQPSGSSIDCTAQDFDFTWFENASIGPGSGTLTTLDTQVTVFAVPLDPIFNGWHRALQGVACAPDRVSAGQLATFVATVGSLRAAGDVTPLTIPGECALTGGLRLPAITGGDTQYTYWIQSTVLAPAGPTPEPTPTPRPRTTKPTPTPAPPSASVSATASASASASATASATASPSPSASAAATATPTVEQSVLAGNPTPTPSTVPPAAPADGESSLPGALAASVAVPSEVSTDPAAIAGSALLALLLLLFMGFASELFNSTVESNYDEIAGWFHLGKRRWFGGALWSTPFGVGLFVALAALIYLLLDPAVALNLESVAVYLGMLLGLGIVLLAFEAPGLVMYRRRTGQSAGVRALPWTLPAAIVCVAISRLLGLEPAYLYGLLLGLVFQQELSSGQEGVQTAVGAGWTLMVALTAWVGLGLAEPGGVPATSAAGLLLSTALAVVVVGGLEAVAFGLLPLRFLAGEAVYRWRRLLWALLFGLSAFFFIHLLVGPHTGYLSQLSPAAIVAALGAFAAFGAFSVLFWAYFRFRPARVTASG